MRVVLEIEELREMQFVVATDEIGIQKIVATIKSVTSPDVHVGAVNLSEHYSKKITKPGDDIYTHYVTVRREGAVEKDKLISALIMLKELDTIKFVSLKFI